MSFAHTVVRLHALNRAMTTFLNSAANPTSVLSVACSHRG